MKASYLYKNKMSSVKIPCFIVQSLENAHVKELLFICDNFQYCLWVGVLCIDLKSLFDINLIFIFLFTKIYNKKWIIIKKCKTFLVNFAST